METIRDASYVEVGFVTVPVPDHWDRREVQTVGKNGRMSKRLRYALLATAFVAGVAGVPLGVYLTLNYAPRNAQVWIILGGLLVIVGVNSVSLGQRIIRWREKRAKIPNGPGADYHDPDPTR